MSSASATGLVQQTVIQCLGPAVLLCPEPPQPDPLERRPDVPCGMDHTHDADLILGLHEEDRIAPVADGTQAGVQRVAAQGRAGHVEDFEHSRLDLSHKGQRAGRIVGSDEIADLDQVRPRGGQDDQAGHKAQPLAA